MPNPSWNQTDQDCDAFDLNWSAHVNGSATLITTTFDGRSVYKYDCPQPGSSNNAYAVNTSLSAWTECTAEVVFRIDGTDGNHIVLQFYLRDSTPHEYNANLYFDTQWTAHPYIWMTAPILGVDLQQWIDIDENGWHTLRHGGKRLHGKHYRSSRIWSPEDSPAVEPGALCRPYPDVDFQGRA